jgi:hypothetical protein
MLKKRFRPVFIGVWSDDRGFPVRDGNAIFDAKMAFFAIKTAFSRMKGPLLLTKTALSAMLFSGSFLNGKCFCPRNTQKDAKIGEILIFVCFAYCAGKNV